MRNFVILLVIVHGFARDANKGKTLKQQADDAFRFSQDDDITFSNEQLKTDDILTKLFPGIPH